MAPPSFRETASTLPLGITVVALYIIFGLAVFSGFATYVYRGEWIETVDQNRSVQPGQTAGEILEVDNLIFVIKRKETLTNQLRARRKDLVEVEKQIALASASYNAAIGQGTRLVERAFVTSREVIQTLSRIGNMDRSDPLARLNTIDQSGALHHQKISRFGTIVENLNAPFDLDEMSKERFLAAKEAYRPNAAGFEEQIIEINAAAHAQRAQEAGLAAERERLVANQKEEEITLAGLTVSSAHQARYESLMLHLPLGYESHVLQRLVSFPTIFLTLIVTIAAGGLGTVVAFSRRYYHENSPGLTASRLFVNVGEGIAAAIAIFLFSGAGMLALTQGGGGPGDVELSPYTVAFVAFLSGFMAEDAFAAIQAAGKRIFNRENNVESPSVADITTDEKPMPVLDTDGSITLKS